MSTFRDQCVTLRKKGHTLTEISRITNRGKTSIFYHIRDIPLGAERMAAVRRAHGAHIREFALLRKGKSERKFKKFDTWNKDLVLLTAHLMFDGEIGRGRCNYNNRSRALLGRFERIMAHLYDFPPKRYLNSHTGVMRICYFNVALGAYMQKKAIFLLEEIRAMPLDLKREFLRAFFDDEGCVYFRGVKKRMVRGYQKDVKVLEIIQHLLNDFGIRSRIVRPNEIVITRKSNLLAFETEVNFSKGVRINGNRSNSIWKESIEKRDLLRRAIATYRL